MPPRYVFWTILIDQQPTAFRARKQDDLLPTLHQLRRTNKDVVLKWFARGRLWDSPEAERAAWKKKPAFAGQRDRDWRPGGAHKDPRARFKKRRRPDDRGAQAFRPGKEAKGVADADKPARVFRPGEKPVARVFGPGGKPGARVFRPAKSRPASQSFKPAEGRPGDQAFRPAGKKRPFRPPPGGRGPESSQPKSAGPEPRPPAGGAPRPGRWKPRHPRRDRRK